MKLKANCLSLAVYLGIGYILRLLHRGELPKYQFNPLSACIMLVACEVIWLWACQWLNDTCCREYCDVDECLSRKQGRSLHLFLWLLLEKLLWHFLFVQQEGERIREQSEEGKKDFTHPDTAACTNDRLQTGKGVLLPYVWAPECNFRGLIVQFIHQCGSKLYPVLWFSAFQWKVK